VTQNANTGTPAQVVPTTGAHLLPNVLLEL
jgi:hypothetical protein